MMVGLVAVAVALAGALPAQEAVDNGAARLRLLDKNTNRVRDVTLVAGTMSSNLPLQVRVRTCVRDVQGVPDQDVVWLDVYALDGGPVFSGWMFNLYPDVSALEHPRYDIRLLECARSAKAVVVQPAAQSKADGSEVKGVDSEAPQAPAKAPDALHDLMDNVQ